MSSFTLSRYYGNATTHCHARVTVTLLWKRYKLTVMQQALLRYYGNALKDLTCHNNMASAREALAVRVRRFYDAEKIETKFSRWRLWYQEIQTRL
jgi:hypothetical protein